MKERVITSGFMIVVALYFILLAPSYVFGGGIFLLASMAVFEWTRLSKTDVNERDLLIGVVVMVAGVIVLTYFAKFLLWLSLLFWVCAAYDLCRFSKSNVFSIPATKKMVYGLFAISSFVFSLMVLREHSEFLVIMLVLIVSFADSVAYFTGKAYGKNKLVPKISPNKTLEGFACGVAAGGIVGLICIIVGIIFSLIEINSFFEFVVLASLIVITSAISVLGDIFESMLKRMAKIKDSGDLFPGHGGVLDRIDGYLPASVFFVLSLHIIGILAL